MSKLSNEENAKLFPLDPNTKLHTLFVLAQMTTGPERPWNERTFWEENNVAFQQLMFTNKPIPTPVPTDGNYKEMMRMEILTQLTFAVTALISQGVRPIPGDQIKVYWDGDKHGTFVVNRILVVNQSDRAARMIMQVFFEPMLNAIEQLP